MTLERKIAAAFALDEKTWQRHANPWSVWSRITVAPLLALAFWSRSWLEWWSLIPIALALLWMWLNPRIFDRPVSTNNWASRAVLGERVWLNRDRIPVPDYHRRLPHVLSSIAAVGAVLMSWGVAKLDFWPSLLGLALLYCGKLWFLDRMVWLYNDMKEASPEYASWLYTESKTRFGKS